MSAVPYDIVNLKYHDTTEGKRLMHEDEMTRYRAQIRKADLAYRNHLGFNPLLGEQTYKVPDPVRPPPFDPNKHINTHRSDESRGF